MKKPITKIAFNKVWALSVSRDEFIKALSPAYPDNDLGSEYDKIVPPKPGKEQVKEK